MKKILVIGGAGYIGSHVVQELITNNYNITVFDNLSSGQLENIPKEAHFVKGDVLDYQSIFSVLKNGFDGIIHLAAMKFPNESMLYPNKYSMHNISGTINVLNAANETKINHLIFTSSSSIYGNPQYLPVDEGHPTTPESFYGYTKLQGEQLIHWYKKLRGLNYIIFRCFNVGGFDPFQRIIHPEKSSINLLPRIMQSAFNPKRDIIDVYGDDYNTPDGSCVRDYVHVSDIASAYVLGLDYLFSREKSLVLNLGSERGYSVKELITTVQEVTGKILTANYIGRRMGDPSIVIASTQQAFDRLGWKPQYSDIHTIIKTMWNVYSLWC